MSSIQYNNAFVENQLLPFPIVDEKDVFMIIL